MQVFAHETTQAKIRYDPTALVAPPLHGEMNVTSMFFVAFLQKHLLECSDTYLLGLLHSGPPLSTERLVAGS
jgi:hypothetical protein